MEEAGFEISENISFLLLDNPLADRNRIGSRHCCEDRSNTWSGVCGKYPVDVSDVIKLLKVIG